MNILKNLYTFFAKPFLNDTYTYAIEYPKNELIERLKYMHNAKSKYTDLELYFDPATRENPGINFEVDFKQPIFGRHQRNQSVLKGYISDNPLQVTIRVGSDIPLR